MKKDKKGTGNMTQSDLNGSRRSNMLLGNSLVGSKLGLHLVEASGTKGGTEKTKTGGFNLFTHQRKRNLEGTEALVMDYKNLREAVLELYLSVKIRSDDEID